MNVQEIDSRRRVSVVATAWFFLFRPWSYTATLVPFLVAAGIAGSDMRDAQWGRWWIGLIVGMFFQATVNLLNTWGDERSGVDSVPGAIRTTPQIHEGQVSMKALLRVALGCAFTASVLGVGLCFHRQAGRWLVDWTLLGAGFIGCLGSLNYSTGIKFKYHGLGVPFVSFLMGPLEIFVALALLLPPGGRDSVLLFKPMEFAWLLLVCLPIASLVGVIMHGNDMRDIPSDKLAGIVTLASWLGPRRALGYYCACHALPYAVCLLLTGTAGCSYLLPFLCLPLTVRTLRTALGVYRSAPENPPWRGLERSSGGILLVFGILYALAAFFGSVL